MKELIETKMQEEPDNPFKQPDEPTVPEPNVPDPYPVSDPITEPNPEPFPTPPEPIPDMPPDVVF